MLAAGGTGGHLFPAEALAAALAGRGVAVELATDARAVGYGGKFPARAMHVIPSATPRGAFGYGKAGAVIAMGVAKAYRLLGRLRPAAVVGFGGYPSIPAVLAARLRRIPTLIHEQNGVMGRANRLLAPRVTAIATSFAGVVDGEPTLAAKATRTGNPLRPAVLAAIAPYATPEPNGPLRLLVFGGSQGARIMADVAPPAVERLDAALRARLSVMQQARSEDIERVRMTYRRIGVAAEVAPFFLDLPTRIAAAHLVVSRSGASTVAELAALGRPAVLVPLPHALDQDQLANARVLESAGGAILLRQDAFTPERLAREIVALAADPARLTAMAAGARSAGAPDAAERLADLVMKVSDLASRPQPR
jgi:UDP-N-acetylglucosamine--N-acetylmuramyl-(pentapeptide) pyrophosphoryl-undecaprenol N-acetylglucosamine transferase